MNKLAVAAAMILCVSVPGADKCRVVKIVVVYKEPGRFGGWPANNDAIGKEQCPGGRAATRHYPVKILLELRNC